MICASALIGEVARARVAAVARRVILFSLERIRSYKDLVGSAD